jgi:hypothetical protein
VVAVVVDVVVLLAVDVNVTDGAWVTVVSSPTFIIELPGPLS